MGGTENKKENWYSFYTICCINGGTIIVYGIDSRKSFS